LCRFDAEGMAGLHDRSSRPRCSPTQTGGAVEAAVLAARAEHRRGQDWLGAELGVAPRTVSRILRRNDIPRLCDCDPLTGAVIRASKTTAVRYERERPGELIHMHSVVDDHSRFAYSEILGDEQADTTAAFFARAVDIFAAHGIPIDAVMTDNAWNYTHSNAFAQLLTSRGIDHILIKPHCPWQNGKVERFNRTLQTEWVYRQPFATNDERSAALAPWLHDYNYQRRHTALGGRPPISRLSRT
jgi:transposase InsO family protein